jgi:hypothetical protein
VSRVIKYRIPKTPQVELIYPAQVPPKYLGKKFPIIFVYIGLILIIGLVIGSLLLNSGIKNSLASLPSITLQQATTNENNNYTRIELTNYSSIYKGLEPKCIPNCDTDTILNYTDKTGISLNIKSDKSWKNNTTLVNWKINVSSLEISLTKDKTSIKLIIKSFEIIDYQNNILSGRIVAEDAVLSSKYIFTFALSVPR